MPKSYGNVNSVALAGVTPVTNPASGPVLSLNFGSPGIVSLSYLNGLHGFDSGTEYAWLTFVAPTGGTLSELAIGVGAINGTVTNFLEWEVFEDATIDVDGSGTSLGSGTHTPSGTYRIQEVDISGAGTITAGKRYGIKVTASSSDGTNNFEIAYSNSSDYGFTMELSEDGTNPEAMLSGGFGIVLSDNTYFGPTHPFYYGDTVLDLDPVASTYRWVEFSLPFPWRPHSIESQIRLASGATYASAGSTRAFVYDTSTATEYNSVNDVVTERTGVSGAKYVFDSRPYIPADRVVKIGVKQVGGDATHHYAVYGDDGNGATGKADLSDLTHQWGQSVGYAATAIGTPTEDDSGLAVTLNLSIEGAPPA